MNAKEILDGCDHMVAACRHSDHDAYGISVCRACADRAVEAAREEIVATLSHSACSYCGHVTKAPPGEERAKLIAAHIIDCPKRPERVLLEQIIWMDEALNAIALGPHQKEAENCDHCIALKALEEVEAIRAWRSP